MKALIYACCSLLLVLAPSRYSPHTSAAEDLRRAVPVEAHLAILGRHNPERDYQRAYLQDVWKTVEDEKLIERISELFTSQIPDDDLQGAKSVFNEIRDATEPIDWKSVANCPEMVYAQVMEPPFTQHLVLIRLTPKDAADCETGLKNLMGLIEKHSGGKVPVLTTTENSVEMTTLGVPSEVPMRPTFARIDDVLLISSSENLARRSLAMLQGSGEPSKFDDKRLLEALEQLPEPEDALVFFDGRQLFSQLRKIGQFIRTQGQGKEKAEQVAGLLEEVIDELSVLDYEVTSEYTDGYRNCVMSIGQLLPGTENRLLRQMACSGEPFENWQSRIPEDAVSYSLSTGVNLHPAYERILSVIQENFPEAQEGLEKFEQAQNDMDVHLDKDILQAFSGETVSLALPGAASTGGPDSIFSLRCHKPERIRELLHRLVDGLQQFPAVQAQQLQLTECEELDGFDEVSAMTLLMVGKRPVIGFHGGWMIIGSHPSAVQKMLDTWNGDAPTIAQSEGFQRFGLTIDGSVTGLSYSNMAESTRQTAQGLQQVGLMAPMIIGMAGANAEPEDLKPLQDALALLPSIANVIAKFDFLESSLAVVQQGDSADTYVKRGVVLVRPPTDFKSDDEAAEQPAAESSAN